MRLPKRCSRAESAEVLSWQSRQSLTRGSSKLTASGADCRSVASGDDVGDGHRFSGDDGGRAPDGDDAEGVDGETTHIHIAYAMHAKTGRGPPSSVKRDGRKTSASVLESSPDVCQLVQRGADPG